MRVVSWNIEWHNKQAGIIKVLKELDADICLLYELDIRSGKKGGDTFSMIKNSCAYDGRLVEEFPAKAGKHSGTASAIFSRYPIQKYIAIDLPTERPSLRHPQTYIYKFLLDRRFGGSRKAQIFSIKANGLTLTIIAAHLELLTSGWGHHKAQLQAAFDAASSRPSIVAGDFNNVQGSVTSALRGRPRINNEIPKVRSWFKEKGLYDPFKDTVITSGKYGIKGKIDWLAADKRLVVKNAQTVWTDVSDHAYLVVDYDINMIAKQPL